MSELDPACASESLLQPAMPVTSATQKAKPILRRWVIGLDRSSRRKLMEGILTMRLVGERFVCISRPLHAENYSSGCLLFNLRGALPCANRAFDPSPTRPLTARPRCPEGV